MSEEQPLPPAMDPIPVEPQEENAEPLIPQDPSESPLKLEDMPTLPTSPRQLRTRQLLSANPALTIPEAMRAAYYTISESETLSLQNLFEDVLTKKTSRRKPGSQEIHPTKRSAPLLSVDYTLPEGIVLCETRPKNAAGRCLCRVEGCRKLDQANNDGFCRSHYNLIVGKDLFTTTEDKDETTGEEHGTSWTCDNCQIVISYRQKRCGNCHRWKNGQRDSTRSSRTPKEDLGSWTCDNCGFQVQNPKSRCGKCHHWKGGKRKGGWTLGSKYLSNNAKDTRNVKVDDIDRTTDWECCGEILPASKTRCGKCRKWRGGKRQIRWSYAEETTTGGSGTTSLMEEPNNVDPNIDWVCKVESCKNVNKGSKKRCFKCFSWRFSRKKARMSAEAVLQSEDANGGGENMMATLDHLDALVTNEMAKQESGDGGYVVNVEGEIGNEAVDHGMGENDGVVQEGVAPAAEEQVNIETV